MKINRAELIKRAAEAHKNVPVLRFGQCLCNTLSVMNSELVEELVESDHDPFYCDDKIEGFFNWIDMINLHDKIMNLKPEDEVDADEY